MATIYPLSQNEAAFGGFTHKLVLDYTDFTSEAAATDTAELVEVLNVAAGTIVLDVATKVITPFDNSEASTVLAIEVGDGGDPNRFLVSQVVGGAAAASAAGYVAYKTTLNNVDTLPHAYTAADTIDVTLTCSGGSNNYIATTTVGEVEVYLRLCDLSKLS